jgi:hypothetical protein
MPENRQSIRPSKPVIALLAAMVLFFAAVWAAVTLATNVGGDHTCQTADKTVPYNGKNIRANKATCR